MPTLASVIVPCFGSLASTRACVAALARHTRRWELVAVDDGSIDGMAHYLAGVADASAFPVRVVTSGRSLGSTTAVNQGLAVARGEVVVLLEPNAVVGEGWLDQLVALAESDPAIGLCGPMSNRANSPQLVEDPSYTDLDGMRRFAADWRAQHRGQWFTTSRLSGPCVLIKRGLLNAVGGLDARLGDAALADLAARAHAGGFTAAVARDCFIHAGPFLAPSTSRNRTTILRLDPPEFARRVGDPDTSLALHGYTVAGDTHAVLTLLSRAKALRVLEVGTAFGHMTANLTEWSPEAARVFTLGIVRGIDPVGAPEQGGEIPDRADLGRLAGHFGRGEKVTFLVGDSAGFDFAALAPLDFAFIDGGHDLAHATGDSRGAYDALAPGGVIAWHDFASPHPWIKVREAIEALAFAEPVFHVAGTEVAFLRKAGPGPDPMAAGAPASGAVRVTWEGGWRGRHSLGLINRALCRALIDLGHDLGLDDGGNPAVDAERLPPDPVLESRSGRPPMGGPSQVHVAHRWPPRLDPPPSGRWAFFQPWEFGSLPRAWLPAIAQAGEVWAYSRSVRDVYLDAGVSENKIRLVPLGVDPAVFRPGVPPRQLPPGPDLRFLFVGGTIYRKGIDLLLEAFARAFRPGDGVGLVVQDMGTQSFYRGQTAEAAIAALRDRGYPIEHFTDSLDPAELAGLYAACDGLVQPYRGEGFALPVVEAMACGLPVIVTGEGPSRDYAGRGVAYPVPARRLAFKEKRVGEIETVGVPWLWEPDVEALAETLRRVAGDRDGAKATGRAASDWIRGRYTWARAAEAAEEGLRVLAGM